MTVKFIQYCNILPGHEDEFKKFVPKKYMAGIDETGLDELVKSLFTRHCEEQSDEAIS